MVTKRKPTPRKPALRRMTLRLDATDEADLDLIVEVMRKDPVIRRLRGRLGREKAVRYAIGVLVESAARGGMG